MRARYHSIACAAVICCGALAYLDTFDVPFQFDDAVAIVENAVVRDLGDPGAIWRFFPQRAVVFASFAIDYRLWGLEVAGYHAVNLAVHLANGMLVYALAFLILTRVGDVRTDGAPSSAAWCAPDAGDRPTRAAIAACLGALVFVLHPIQTQAVTYIWQRTTSLAALFSLAAILAHTLGVIARSTRTRRLALAVALGCGVLAMHTKESAFALPFAIVLLELTLLARVEAAPRPRIARCVAWALLVPIVPLEVILLGDPAAEHIDAMSELDPLSYFATQLDVLWRYLGLIAVPSGQSVDHDVPVRESLFAPGASLSLIAILGVVALAWRTRRRTPIVAFAVVFFFLAQATESSFLPLADVMFEHRIYLPLFAVALLAARFVWVLPIRGGVLVTAAGTLALSLGIATAARNEVWKTPIALWEDAAAKAPQKFRPQENLGQAYLECGDHRRAARAFERALGIRPDHPRMLYKLAICESELGHPWSAETAFRRAVEVDPELALAHLNLGIHLAREGRPAAAAVAIADGLAHRPRDAQLREHLIACLIDAGDDARLIDAVGRLVDDDAVSEQLLARVAERLRVAGRGDLLARVASRLASTRDRRAEGSAAPGPDSSARSPPATVPARRAGG